MSLEGYEVLTIEPHFAQTPTLRGTFANDRVELSQADILLSYRGKHPVHVLNFEFELHGQTAIREMEDFFFDRAGKWQPFWVPSWHAELQAAANLTTGNNQLSITPVDYDAVYFQETATPTRLGNYIFLLNQDGTLWTPQVSSVSGTSPEILTLATNAAIDWIVGEFIIGFMYFVRWMNDELSLNYSGAGVATSQLSMIEVMAISSDADDAGDPEIEGIAFYDEFDSYDVGQTTNLNRGWAWLSAWDNTDQTGGHDEVFYDDFSSYTASSGVNGTAIDGDGGSGNFVAG